MRDRRDFKTAAIGLIGALIGGLLSTGGVIYAQNAESDREDERRLEAARGAVHLFIDEYRGAGLYLERMVMTGVVTKVPSDAAITVSDEDRRLMASNLEPDAYGRASEAATVTNYILSRLEARGRGRPFLARMRTFDENMIRLALRELAEGREALRPLSGETPAVTPKPLLRQRQPGFPPDP
jgi:hypothetical protein